MAMTYLSITPQENRPAIISLIAGYLKRGQVVVLPTDTIYGFSALATKKSALQNIYRLKKRDPKKPLIILVSSLAMLKKYAFVSRRQASQVKKYYLASDRPTTLILSNRGLLPKELASSSGGLAIRLPKSKFLIKIIRKLRAPIVSTSLNLSGQANIRDLKLLASYFSPGTSQPDLICDAGPDRRSRPSRLVDLRSPDQPVVLRK